MQEHLLELKLCSTLCSSCTREEGMASLWGKGADPHPLPSIDRPLLLLFLLLIASGGSRATARDCTGVECQPLENCIVEALDPGACCAHCLSNGCRCEGYQYYDCLRHGYRNGRVPAGDGYLVDSGSTECRCPQGGGHIACRFLPCPELPQNCIEEVHPLDRCPECARRGCHSNGKTYEEGHSFLVEPCTVCHCLNSGSLVCTPSTICKGLEITPSDTVDHPKKLGAAKSQIPRKMYRPQRILATLPPVLSLPTPQYQQTVHKPSPELRPHHTRHDPRQALAEPSISASGANQASHDPRSHRPVQDSHHPMPESHQAMAGFSQTPPHLPPHHPGYDSRHSMPEQAISVSSSNQASPEPQSRRPVQDSHQPIPESHQAMLDFSQTSPGLPSRHPQGSQRTMSGMHHSLSSFPLATPVILSHGSAHDPQAEKKSHRALPGFRQKSKVLPSPHPAQDLRQAMAKMNHTLAGFYQAAPELQPSRFSQDSHPPSQDSQYHDNPPQESQDDQPPPADSQDHHPLPLNSQGHHPLPQDTQNHHPPPQNFHSVSEDAFPSSQDSDRPFLWPRDSQLPQDSQDPGVLPGLTSRWTGAPQEAEQFQATLNACCTAGHQWHSAGKKCSDISPNAQDMGHCRSVQAQCCRSLQEEGECQAGAAMAQRGGHCLTSEDAGFSGSVHQRCCECCSLGLTARTLGVPCDAAPPLGMTCGQMFSSCCQTSPSSNRREPRRPQHMPADDPEVCRDGQQSCGPDRRCQEAGGSFWCHPKPRCPPGYRPGPLCDCSDMNECVTLAQPCSPGYRCVNTVGSFTCHRQVLHCGRGYHASEDGTRCEDIDECESGRHRCQEGQTCHNAPGSYRCDCPRGYQVHPLLGRCHDVDECQVHSGRICSQHCENTAGSYSCTCSPGYQLSLDNRSCEDVNECESAPCHQECANVYGSYHCHCRQGYILSPLDQTTCQDVDECAAAGGSVCSFHCVNTLGSFHCTCPPHSFLLTPNGRNCRDQDECTLGIHNCSGSESCFNIHGGFRCLTFPCPSNYHRADDTQCERLTCTNYRDCQAEPQRISYYHLTFPSNIQVPANIFRISPSPVLAGDATLLAIPRGNQEGYFSTRRANSHMGYVFLQVAPHEPRDFLLDVEMTLIRQGTAAKFLARLYVFITGPSL